MMIVTKEAEEMLNEGHRCVKCKHWSVRAKPSSDPPGPIICGTCTKCDKGIIASDPYNGAPNWCPGYEALGKTVPVEEKEEPAKEVTNDDIANMLQRIHHENCIIFSAIASLALIDNTKIDLVIDDWIEKFKKAKGEY